MPGNNFQNNKREVGSQPTKSHIRFYIISRREQTSAALLFFMEKVNDKRPENDGRTGINACRERLLSQYVFLIPG